MMHAERSDAGDSEEDFEMPIWSTWYEWMEVTLWLANTSMIRAKDTTEKDSISFRISRDIGLAPQSPLRAVVFVAMWFVGRFNLVIWLTGFKATSATYIESCLKPLLKSPPAEADRKKWFSIRIWLRLVAPRRQRNSWGAFCPVLFRHRKLPQTPRIFTLLNIAYKEVWRCDLSNMTWPQTSNGSQRFCGMNGHQFRKRS